MFRNIIICVLIFIAGAVAGKWGLPSKVVEKEHIVYQDRIVTKEVEAKSTIKKDNKTYIKTVTTKTDGTKVEETKIIDKDTTSFTDNKTNTSEDEKKSTTDKEKTTTYGADVLLSVGLNSDMSYSAEVQKKIVGPIYLGITGSTKRLFGFNIGLAL